MQAKELMTQSVECISPETLVTDAARTMKSRDVGFLPVCEKNRLVGTLTDRDIVLRVIAEDKDLGASKVSDIMTRNVFWCYEDHTSDEVANFMAEKEVRRLVVLNRQKKLVGVISIGDLAQKGEEHVTGKTIKDIANAPPARAA
jgi:CBS domain-containing protein